MTSKPTVAIAGASGRQGKLATQVILSPQFRNRYKEVILLSRNPDFKVPGATTRTYGESEADLLKALEDVDVVVNIIGAAGPETKKLLGTAVAKSPSVKLYFPSEFGVDHNLNGGTDPDFEHIEWKKKKDHIAQVKAALPSGRSLKICSIYPSLMTDLSIGPWFGLDTQNRKYEAVGSVDSYASFTTLEDIGRAIAVLASLTPDKVPEQVRLSGDRVSVRDIARLMEEAAGDGKKIELSTRDLEEFKREAVANPGDSPAIYLRFLIGNGKLDFSKEGLGNNGNELVNPGEELWKWKTMKDYAKETKGRPYCSD